MLRIFGRFLVAVALAGAGLLTPSIGSFAPGSSVAQAQDSPLELLQKRQQRTTQRAGGVRVISGQPRRVQTNRGRGLFTNLEQPAGVTIFEQPVRRRQVFQSVQDQSPLDVLLKERRPAPHPVPLTPGSLAQEHWMA